MLSEHFSLSEAAKSQTALRLGIDNAPPLDVVGKLEAVAANILEPCRDNFAVPFSPSSWYRSPELNRAIKGAGSSQHVTGEAVDFEIPGIPNERLARWIADNLEFDQLILEFWKPNDPTAGWVHCSYVAGANRRQVLRFDGKHYIAGLP
jgi:hypothetical protein